MKTTEYHKIETIYERDEKTHRLKQPLVLKNRVYGLVNPWVWTEKVDGTNIRATWNGSTVVFGGRTDNAAIDAQLFAYLNANVTRERFEAAFPEIATAFVAPLPQGSTPDVLASVILYGEGYGAGIQRGGDYSPEKKLMLFDVVVRDAVGHDWWLSDENVRDVGKKFGLDVVPSFGEMTLAEATAIVRAGFSSQIGVRPAEGLVGRPAEALFDKKGHRLIVKLKTKDF